MRQAMIFAAGLGTRLRPLTDDRPKALVEVEGKPLLEHAVMRLRQSGFSRIVVNIHHFGQQIIDFLRSKDNFGIDILISDERELLLDTGGGIRHALPLFVPDEPVLIHNVDIVSDIDLSALYGTHLAGRAAATLAINERVTQRYLMFDDERHLCGWTNVKTGEVKGEMGEKYAFAGIHVVGQEMLGLLSQYDAAESFPIIPFYIENCRRAAIASMDVTANAWVDCGKVETLAKAAAIVQRESMPRN